MTAATPDYVLPLKWQDDADLEDLTGYLRWLAGRARVIVADGSPPEVFARHRQRWSAFALHLPVAPGRCLNGKVAGVHTGLAHATAEAVVVADDDVRYDEESLRRTVDLLRVADLVGPQNVFSPMPWHAAWDTARSLLNRAVAADYPGTFAVRRSTFLAMGGYSGDVLFENLELMRTVRAHGGRVLRPLDVYVVRRPPALRRFLQQRPRQAYDDLAQPWRLAAFLTVVPAALSGRTGRRAVAVALLGCVALAEVGRRRGGGRAVFPPAASWLAPAWVLERSLCAWSALAQRFLFGGVRYAGRRLPVAAHSIAGLRRQAGAAGRPLVTGRGPESGRPVGPVAERRERRAAATAQRDRAPAGVDAVAVGVHDDERPADEQRPVLAGRDHRTGRAGPLATGLPIHGGETARAEGSQTAAGSSRPSARPTASAS